MKTFKSVVMVRTPPSAVYECMRDHLPDLARAIPDVDSVVELHRGAADGRAAEILNEWRVRDHIPAALKRLLGAGELGWLDRGRWHDLTCSWSIEPFFLQGQIACSGSTRFEPAMAGKGARVTLEGTFEIKQGFLLSSASVLEKPVLSFAEFIVTTVLPKNLRSLVEAAASYVDRQPSKTL
jgi:hypothetical protein